MDELEEIKRLIRNLIRTGTIYAVDGDVQLVRVKTGELITNWLPWCNMRAGSVRVHSTPSSGEQCIVLSPFGNLAQGVAITGIYSNIITPPDSGPNDLVLEVPEDGKLVMQCGSSSIEISAENIKQKSKRIDLN